MLIRNFTILLLLYTGSKTAFADTCGKKNPLVYIDEAIDGAICSLLPIGVEKIINFDSNSSPTGVAQKYILERIGEKDYKVKLKLNFVEGSTGLGNTPLTQKMSNKVRGCLGEINQYLRGPDDEKIILEIMPNDQKNKVLDSISNKIFVDDNVRRLNSEYYGMNAPCSTIAHELLHLMGLTDEYPEIEDMKFYQKECRTYGPEDSIMNNQKQNNFETEWSSGKSSVKVFVRGCICDDSSGCDTYSEKQRNQMISCPSGYKEIKTSFHALHLPEALLSDSLKRQIFSDNLNFTGYGDPMGSKRHHEAIVLSAQKSSKPPGSYLYPAQFRVITKPGCKKVNKIYFGCAKQSRDRPNKYFGFCNNRPRECADPLEWLK